MAKMTGELAVVFHGPRPKNGRKVFHSFIHQNRQMFWNRELTAACDSVSYSGYKRPGTLFLEGPPAQLAVLKDSWARRILKPATGFTITSLGDFGPIQQVEQKSRVPLGDIICDAIAQLNRNGRAATEQAIRQYVARHCPHVAPPGVDMVRQTIGSLDTAGYVYKMGHHYFVSVPTNSPVRPKATANTVECQTGVSILQKDSSSSDDNQIAAKKNTRRSFFAKLFSRGLKPNPMPPVSPIIVGYTPTRFPLPSPPAAAAVGTLPIKNKYPTYHHDLNEECHRRSAGETEKQQKNRRRRRREEKIASSSSECLKTAKFYPVDMPDMDAPNVARPNRRRPRLASPLRSSTPNHSDSAYSISPADSAEDACSVSDSEVNHTYMNVNKFRPNEVEDFTQYEDLTGATSFDEPQILAHQMRGVLISNL